MRPETRLARGHVIGVDRSTAWPYEAGEPGPFHYSRYAHPTGVEVERLLGELDGGEALLFPSGSAAATALVLALLEPRATIALADDAYYGTSALFRALEPWGVRFVEFDQTSPHPPDGADLVWLEAPSNPLLGFPALRELVDAAHAAGARVVVDATAATPVLLRPLEHGADAVLHSATKYLSGHSDVLLGVVTLANESDAERLRTFRGRTGIVAGPDPAWLLLRGLRTLALRVARCSATALELARRLEAHPAVERVRYPGLRDERAARYLEGGFGGLLSFDVAGGAEAARAVETSTRLIVNETSLGGVHSVLETRARWEAGRVPPNLIRLSVGLEDVDDLWNDLERALLAGS